jgi:hypothetical protein
MLDLLLLATMFVVCGGIGLPLAELLAARFAWRLLLAPTLGCAVLSVAVTVAYRWGVSIAVFFYVTSALAATVLAVRARPMIRAAALASLVERRLTIAAAATVSVATLVMLAPRWVGGDQFSVFQGNHWDTYAYLDSAMVYAHEPYSAVVGATDQQIIRNPLYALAQTPLTDRPSVQQLYAVFSRVAPDQAYRLYYPFLIFFFSQFVLVALFVLRNALPSASPTVWLAAALVFPLGFWGQYVLDINAWSQVAATPVLFLIFGLLLDTAARTETATGPALRLAGVLAAAVAGAVFIYPEGFLIYAAALFPIATAVPVYRMVRARRFAIRPLLPLLGILGIAATVLYGPLLHHLLSQVTHTSDTRVSWWKFFQMFFFGRDGYAGINSVDFAAGLFGLYFATPAAGASAALAAVQRSAITATVLALFVGLAAVLAGRVKLSSDQPETRVRLGVWGVASVMLLMPAILLAMDRNYWPAGKVVSYASPVFMTLVCVPIAYEFAPSMLRPVRWIIGAFMAFQVGTGIARISAADAPHGIHYAPPYPAIQDPALKRNLSWDLGRLESALTRETRVLLQPMNPWPANHLMVFLYSRRIPFALAGKVNTYFGSGRDLPGVPPPWEPDADITREDTALVVRFRDGRPPVRVVSYDALR